MSEYTPHHQEGTVHPTGDLHSHGADHQPHDYNLFPGGHWISGNESILHHADPLSVSNQFTMAPLKIHMVKPHVVQGYTREDGTHVKPYIRDGHGAGYLRSNPDGLVSNNLNYLLGKS